LLNSENLFKKKKFYREILEWLKVGKETWQLGTSKVFMKGSVNEILEGKRMEILNKSATKIQAHFKMAQSRKSMLIFYSKKKRLKIIFLKRIHPFTPLSFNNPVKLQILEISYIIFAQASCSDSNSIIIKRNVWSRSCSCASRNEKS